MHIAGIFAFTLYSVLPRQSEKDLMLSLPVTRMSYSQVLRDDVTGIAYL